MTSAYDSIARGLQEAIDLNKGHKIAARTHRQIGRASCRERV